jgi:hypothetical protein
LLGVLLGAAITGIGAIWKDRTAHKKVVARALTELLEIRHQIGSFNLVVEEVQKHVTLPAEFLPPLRKLLDDLTPVDRDANRRYEEAVSVLAEVDPLLAFQLRSRNKTQDLLGLPAVLAPQSGFSAADVDMLERSLQQMVLPHLDDSIAELARVHSWKTKRRVLKLLAQKRTVPPEVTAWITHVKNLSTSAGK